MKKDINERSKSGTKLTLALLSVFLPNVEPHEKPFKGLQVKLIVSHILAQFVSIIIVFVTFKLSDLSGQVGVLYQTHFLGLIMILVTVNCGVLIGMVHGLAANFSITLCVSNMLAVMLVLTSLYIVKINLLVLVSAFAMVLISGYCVLGVCKGLVMCAQATVLALLLWQLLLQLMSLPFAPSEAVSEIAQSGIFMLAMITMVITLLLSDFLKGHVSRYFQHQAMHDDLTGLVNRHYFSHRVIEQLAYAKRMGSQFGIIYIDVNDFKSINDNHGHATGDVILKTISMAISGCLRLYDVGARIGGDEFAVLVGGDANSDILEMMKERVRVAINQGVECNGHFLAISASIGSSLFPDDAECIEGLISAADQKMYSEKSRIKEKLIAEFETSGISLSAETRQK